MTTRIETIKFEAEQDSNFKVTHVDGASGALNQNIGQLTLFYDIPDFTMGNTPIGSNPEMKVAGVRRVLVIDARMSPEVFKSIAKWMTDRVNEYENTTHTQAQAPKFDPLTSYQ